MIARAFNKKMRPRNLKEEDLVLKCLEMKFFIREESQDGLGLLLSRRSCQKVLPELQIWMGKRCFAQSTWIDSEDTTFEEKKVY